MQVFKFDELLLNIYSNYIPNKTVLCDGKNHPWVAGFRSWMRYDHYAGLDDLTTELSNLIHDMSLSTIES